MKIGLVFILKICWYENKPDHYIAVFSVWNTPGLFTNFESEKSELFNGSQVGHIEPDHFLSQSEVFALSFAVTTIFFFLF